MLLLLPGRWLSRTAALVGGPDPAGDPADAVVLLGIVPAAIYRVSCSASASWRRRWSRGGARHEQRTGGRAELLRRPLERVRSRLVTEWPIVISGLMVVGFLHLLGVGPAFDAGRGDFFYLADAFLHGRTWLDVRLGYQDVIIRTARLRPVRPVPGDRADAARRAHRAGDRGPLGDRSSTPRWPRRRRPVLVVLRPAGVRSLGDRVWLVVLFGFSTQIWWVTTRGGVWHTGQLIATILTLICLIELWGAGGPGPDRAARRRRVPDPGAARLRHARSTPDSRRRPDPAGRRQSLAVGAVDWLLLALGVLP